eukprot:9497655-Ditylum_brightwellii.AAC.1
MMTSPLEVRRRRIQRKRLMNMCQMKIQIIYHIHGGCQELHLQRLQSTTDTQRKMQWSTSMLSLTATIQLEMSSM